MAKKSSGTKSSVSISSEATTHSGQSELTMNTVQSCYMGRKDTEVLTKSFVCFLLQSDAHRAPASPGVCVIIQTK